MPNQISDYLDPILFIDQNTQFGKCRIHLNCESVGHWSQKCVNSCRFFYRPNAAARQAGKREKEKLHFHFSCFVPFQNVVYFPLSTPKLHLDNWPSIRINKMSWYSWFRTFRWHWDKPHTGGWHFQTNERLLSKWRLQWRAQNQTFGWIADDYRW